ncbi:unnamed protein product [Closterium sp. NIES-53]
MALARRICCTPSHILLILPHCPSLCTFPVLSLSPFRCWCYQVMAGLASSTPHGQSAAIMSLARLIFHFSSSLLHLVPSLLPSLLLLFRSPHRDVLKACLGLVKVLSVRLETGDLEIHLPAIMTALLSTNEIVATRFKAKCNDWRGGVAVRHMRSPLPSSHPSSSSPFTSIPMNPPSPPLSSQVRKIVQRLVRRCGHDRDAVPPDLFSSHPCSSSPFTSNQPNNPTPHTFLLSGAEDSAAAGEAVRPCDGGSSGARGASAPSHSHPQGGLKAERPVQRLVYSLTHSRRLSPGHATVAAVVPEEHQRLLTRICKVGWRVSHSHPSGRRGESQGFYPSMCCCRPAMQRWPEQRGGRWTGVLATHSFPPRVPPSGSPCVLYRFNLILLQEVARAAKAKEKKRGGAGAKGSQAGDGEEGGDGRSTMSGRSRARGWGGGKAVTAGPPCLAEAGAGLWCSVVCCVVRCCGVSGKRAKADECRRSPHLPCLCPHSPLALRSSPSRTPLSPHHPHNEQLAPLAPTFLGARVNDCTWQLLTVESRAALVAPQLILMHWLEFGFPLADFALSLLRDFPPALLPFFFRTRNWSHSNLFPDTSADGDSVLTPHASALCTPSLPPFFPPLPRPHLCPIPPPFPCSSTPALCQNERLEPLQPLF